MSNEQKYYTIVSNKGKQAVIKALANKELIDLTTMSVGDGENPIDANWESLPNEKDKFGITQIKIVDNITLEVTGILSAQKGGYMIRQAGLYTSDNILFAIAQLPQTAKPVLSDGASKDMTIKFVITIADTSVVNLSIDPNINIITQSRLDEVIELNANELRAEIEDKVDALKQETTTNLATLATKADKTTTYTKTEVNNLVNAKANANATVNLTGAQSIAGVKTFTNNIVSPNITAMQNSINTINTSLRTVVSETFTPYLILKNAPLGFKAFSLQDRAGQNEIDTLLEQAVKYRFYRLYIYGTVTGN
ncbi:MAG: phage tail protein, partial [Campylobacter sp.]|nr:phage tail protein [Campylobacter sp.]